MIVTDVTGSFFVPMKVTLLVAFLIALPWVLYQIWKFVAPGLYQHEKRLILPLVSSSYVLFLCGVTFAYFPVFPRSSTSWRTTTRRSGRTCRPTSTSTSASP